MGSGTGGNKPAGGGKLKQMGGLSDKKAMPKLKGKGVGSGSDSDSDSELFEFIGKYKVPKVEIETQIKCFIPDYVPAIGSIDCFVKPARPDGKPEDIGLQFVDEPNSSQSDHTVLELQLRAKSKKRLGEAKVSSIEHADKEPDQIAKWIKDIDNLHRDKPPPEVNYSKPMPEIEALMQAWPEDFEEKLNHLRLPTADIDLSIR